MSRFDYLRSIDPVALAGTVEKLTEDGNNVVRLYYGDDGRIVSATVTRREGLPRARSIYRYGTGPRNHSATSMDELSVGDRAKVKFIGLIHPLYGTISDVHPNGDVTVTVTSSRGTASIICPPSWVSHWPPRQREGC